MIRPLKLFTPTATTTYRPTPSSTLLPLTMKQSMCDRSDDGCLGCPPMMPSSPRRTLLCAFFSARQVEYGAFLMASASPVAADSSHLTLCPEMKIPSQGTTSPGSSNATSPTTTSYETRTHQKRRDIMRITHFDINEMLLAIANYLDGALILLLVECFELAFFLPVI